MTQKKTVECKERRHKECDEHVPRINFGDYDRLYECPCHTSVDWPAARKERARTLRLGVEGNQTPS